MILHSIESINYQIYRNLHCDLSQYRVPSNFLKNSSSILFRSLVLLSFIAENTRSLVAVETGKVTIRRINLQMKNEILLFDVVIFWSSNQVSNTK